jgi:hypothetical protein
MVEYMMAKHLAGSDVADMTPGNHTSPKSTTSTTSSFANVKCSKKSLVRSVAVLTGVAAVAGVIGAFIGNRFTTKSSTSSIR